MSLIPHWNSLLVVAVVAVILTTALNTAQADLVLSGNTFYSYDFQDVSPGSHPTSTSPMGEVEWAGIGQSSRTRVNAGPVVGGNKTLRSDPLGSSSSTGQVAVFSAAMASALPTEGTIDFRLYLDELVSSPSVFRVMKSVNTGLAFSINNANTLFGVVAEAGGNLKFNTDSTFNSMRSVVLDEWIDISIDYSLDNSADNLKVTLNSNSISNETFTYTKDLTGATTNGFVVYSPGGGDNVFHVDDINWVSTVAAVPEPSSFAFFSLVAMLATGNRRKKSV